jgi:hypothetical protein
MLIYTRSNAPNAREDDRVQKSHGQVSIIEPDLSERSRTKKFKEVCPTIRRCRFQDSQSLSKFSGAEKRRSLIIEILIFDDDLGISLRDDRLLEPQKKFLSLVRDRLSRHCSAVLGLDWRIAWSSTC